MLNTDTLKELLTDPELRTRALRLLKQKIQADALTAEANAYLVRQLVNLVRRSGDGTAAAHALHDVIKQYLDFGEILVNRQFEFNKSLMEKLQTLSDSAAPAPTTVTMNLSAAPDTTVRKPFQIDNTRRAPISVGFETNPFVSEDGTHSVTAEMTFDPPSLDLQPEQEARIELILRVSDQFKPNTVYLATVTVHGLDAPQLLVRLAVQPKPQDVGTPTAPPAAESKTTEASTADATSAKPHRPRKSKAGTVRRAKPAQAKGKTP